MSEALISTVLVSLISGLIVLLLTAIAWGIRRWVGHVDRLQGSLDTLRDSILTLSEKFVTRDQHDRDMEAIRGLGRRATDHCPLPDCPHEARR